MISISSLDLHLSLYLKGHKFFFHLLYGLVLFSCVLETLDSLSFSKLFFSWFIFSLASIFICVSLLLSFVLHLRFVRQACFPALVDVDVRVFASDAFVFLFLLLCPSFYQYHDFCASPLGVL